LETVKFTLYLKHCIESMFPGRYFDKQGNMANWWTDESANNFEEKTKCLANQYSKYKVEDGHVSTKYLVSQYSKYKVANGHVSP
jgi:predicted metalloendopeptidase